ncbi:MAG: MFS transporter, partial [Rhizobiaceae bacterium]|nr:MFS transporter [Rhizobiaceae bacterium]
ITIATGCLSALLYVRHARRVTDPILDLRLLRNPVFRAAIVGGTIYRVGVGATPFLLPLLFQLGFGMTPFQSGLLTLASAAGALSMKLFAPATLRRGGFRTVLIGAAVLSAVFVALNALLTPSTPWAVIVALLFGAGFLRSLFFTSVNALAFAEVEETEASQATTISAAAQQISVALGVALGGGILEASTWFTGHALTAEGFTVAFLAIAAVAASSAIVFAQMPKGAGSAVSGHQPQASAGAGSRL